MAKAKKKEITIEEALVPAEEQPYEVPENWCWVKALSVLEIEYGKGISTKELVSDGYPVFGANGLIGYYSEYMFGEEMALMSCRGAYSGVMNLSVPFSFVTSNSLVMNNRGAFVSSRFIYYLFKALDTHLLVSGSAQPQVTVQAFNDYFLPIPPVPEQQRIVERIESLFSKLDEAKEKAQEALESFEIRKKSIIHKAFTGKLTAEWRNQNGVSLDTWGKMVLGDVCESIYDGDHMPPPKSENGIPFLVISNVNDGYLSFDNTRFVPEDYYNSLSDSRKPKKGDVLYTLVGSYGIPVVVDTDKAFCFQRHMGLLKPQLVDTYFLWYQLQSDVVYEKATAIATGTAQLTVPIRGLRKIEIAVPTMDEQKEIVRILDEIFTKEEKQKKNTARVIEQINVLKKSVLSKAFRGKLGTNDPSEGSAEELLKSILQQS